MTLITNRLLLRPIVPWDAEKLFETWHSGTARLPSDAPTFEYTRDDPWSEETCQSFASAASSKFQCSEEFAFAITSNDIFHGFCGLFNMTSEFPIAELRGKWEIGWILNTRSHGNAFASVTAKKIFDWGISEKGLERVFASCDGANKASESVMKKIGMERFGLFQEQRIGNSYFNKGNRDELVYVYRK
jgi:RimJ/RimL family protein N-acetyltransferase